jgi:transposase
MTVMHQGERVHGRTLEAWVMDEHRIGLKPLLRRIWALRGHRPIVRVHPRYEWLYIYAFVHPTTGRSFYLLMPTVSIEAFTIALQEFATAVGLKDDLRLLLVVDNAGWHVSPQVQCPCGLDLRFLPAYSPELQPAEHMWALTDVPLVNQCFDSLEALEQVLVDRCCWLEQQLDLVRSATLFDWWPTVV